MTVYLSSPMSQLQADHCRGMPVLLSFGAYKGVTWIDDYVPSFPRLLIDSGAYSTLNTGVSIDLDAYAEWASKFTNARAIASLDDIAGDWEQGLRNWERYPTMFPTFHDTDPWEALDAILAKKPKWIGLGMKPPRTISSWLDESLERIPASIHIHGWALRAFSDRQRLDSFDSTNWFRDAWKIKKGLPWLTHGETLEIIVKRYQREHRTVKTRSTTPCLFDTQ